MVEEKLLYPSVERYLKNQFLCFETGSNKGTQPLGNVDVFGVRDVGGKLSGDSEVIIVEVKTGVRNFGKQIGQALGYSICGHRCYLGCLFPKGEKFKDEHKEIANHLGVGLIEIRKTALGYRCQEVLSSTLFSPKDYFLLNLLYRIGIARCVFCRTFQDLNDSGRWGLKTKGFNVHLERNLLYSNSKKKRFYVCGYCSDHLDFGQMDNMKHNKIIKLIKRRLKERGILTERNLEKIGEIEDKYTDLGDY